MTKLLAGLPLSEFFKDITGAGQQGAQSFYGPSLFGEISTLLTGKSAPSGKTVILLPGILASSLVDAADSKLLWLELLGLTVGNGMARLRAGDDRMADGGAGTIVGREPLVAIYGPMYAYFSEVCGFDTRAFGFDWRLSMRHAVTAFDAFMSTVATKKVTIVAHSMGSLITRRWAQLHPDQAGRIEQAIFMGPPFSGSFAPLEGLSGRAWFSSILGTAISVNTLVSTLGTFPGFAELLPDDSPGKFPGSWANFANPQGPLASFDKGLLGRARDFNEEFRNPGDAGLAADDALMRRSSIILGTRLRTAVDADFTGGSIGFRYAPFGDNTVPVTSAWDDRSNNYETRFPHSNIPQDPWVIRGVAQLIASGGRDPYPLTALQAPPGGFQIPPGRGGLESLEAFVEQPVARPIDPALVGRIEGNVFTNADLASIFSTGAPAPADTAPRTRAPTVVAAIQKGNLESLEAVSEGAAEMGSLDRRLRSLQLAAEASKQGAWQLRKSPRIRLAEGLTATPDFAGWSPDRPAASSGGEPITVLPSWCAEVLSPTTARDIRSIKLSLYAASGIAWIWVIDPALQTIEIFRSHGGNPVLLHTVRGDESVTVDPFEGELSLRDFWA
jgi:pimeloyl-ACP methyl ester carboxylesterase